MTWPSILFYNIKSILQPNASLSLSLSPCCSVCVVSQPVLVCFHTNCGPKYADWTTSEESHIEQQTLGCCNQHYQTMRALCVCFCMDLSMSGSSHSDSVVIRVGHRRAYFRSRSDSGDCMAGERPPCMSLARSILLILPVREYSIIRD